MNTRLPGDFGLHIEGCRDIDLSLSSDTLDLPSIDACEKWLIDDMIAGGFDPEDAAGFDLHVYPCAKLGEDASR